MYAGIILNIIEYVYNIYIYIYTEREREREREQRERERETQRESVCVGGGGGLKADPAPVIVCIQELIRLMVQALGPFPDRLLGDAQDSRL